MLTNLDGTFEVEMVRPEVKFWPIRAEKLRSK